MGGLLSLGGVCPVRGVGVCSEGVCLVREGLVQGGWVVCSWGVCLVWGGLVQGEGGGLLWGGGIPACTEADPPVNRMTDRCKNITLATTLLRPVNITLPQTSFAGGKNHSISNRVKNEETRFIHMFSRDF